MKTRLFHGFCLAAFLLSLKRLICAQAGRRTPPSRRLHRIRKRAPALTTPQGKVPPPPGAVDIASEPIVKVVANVQPAVVNITAQQTVPQYVSEI